MRRGFVLALIATILFSGGYAYHTAQAICPVPISYRIGEFDDRFAISQDEAQVVVAEAEAVWEDATGRELFSYDESADFVVNFIFDDRQALADAERDFRDRLNTTAAQNETLGATHTRLLADYNSLSTAYERDAAAYERALAVYNATVEEYNREGGAPPDAIVALDVDRAALSADRAALNRTAAELNDLVADINALGEQGNRLIETYNRNVETYNETFGGSREFTQGDYQGDHINIYTFADRIELRTVLAHELGHALGIDHVENERSVMYYLMGGQPADVALTPEDLTEFVRMCGADASTAAQIIRTLRLYLDGLRQQLATLV